MLCKTCPEISNECSKARIMCGQNLHLQFQTRGKDGHSWALQLQVARSLKYLSKLWTSNLNVKVQNSVLGFFDFRAKCVNSKQATKPKNIAPHKISSNLENRIKCYGLEFAIVVKYTTTTGNLLFHRSWSNPHNLVSYTTNGNGISTILKP